MKYSSKKDQKKFNVFFNQGTMDYDTVIVGGGPAGLAAAFFLKGRTAVIERLDSNYDRYHSICGEGISEDAFASLRPMEPWAVKNHVSVTKLKWPGGKILEIGNKGYILDRPKFLKELRNRCDTEFIHGNVVDIEDKGDRYEVMLGNGSKIRCRYLIGADGCYSVVRKKIFGSEPLRTISVKHAITEEEHDGSMTIELSERYDGTYRWTFPSGDNVSIGCMTSVDEMQGTVRKIPIGCVKEVVKGNAFLAGDAAGMANPISFGGLKAALLAGKNAANAINKGDPKVYGRWWSFSILSSNKFMKFHEKLRKWSDDDMKNASKPFRNGHLAISAITAILTKPWNINMYVGCLFAFKFSW